MINEKRGRIKGWIFLIAIIFFFIPLVFAAVDIGFNKNQPFVVMGGAKLFNWNNLFNFPSGCPAGEAVQIIGNTLTCIAVGGGGNGTGENQTNNSLIFVPYTGATTDIDLGIHSLTLDHIHIPTSPIYDYSGTAYQFSIRDIEDTPALTIYYNPVTEDIITTIWDTAHFQVQREGLGIADQLGTHYTFLQTQSQEENITYYFPNALPPSDKCLSSNATGELYWINCSGGADTLSGKNFTDITTNISNISKYENYEYNVSLNYTQLTIPFMNTTNNTMWNLIVALNNNHTSIGFNPFSESNLSNVNMTGNLTTSQKVFRIDLNNSDANLYFQIGNFSGTQLILSTSSYFRFSNSLIPHLTTLDIGGASNYWNKGYFNTLHATAINSSTANALLWINTTNSNSSGYSISNSLNTTNFCLGTTCYTSFSSFADTWAPNYTITSGMNFTNSVTFLKYANGTNWNGTGYIQANSGNFSASVNITAKLNEISIASILNNASINWTNLAINIADLKYDLLSNNATKWNAINSKLPSSIYNGTNFTSNAGLQWNSSVGSFGDLKGVVFGSVGVNATVNFSIVGNRAWLEFGSNQNITANGTHICIPDCW